MNLPDTVDISLSRRRIYLFNLFRNKNWILILCFGIIGFVLPMTHGYFNGLPLPDKHDEFSYLLAADTFAHGRINNLTPVSPENFETPQVLIEPTYMSRYPPMQGILLATGQVVFGQPYFGIWLTCGLAAAALFWMLCAWTRPRWAIFGTLMMILFIGINSYWTQSFWGGMPAFMGGTLFLGGFRRLFRRKSVWSTTLMVLGGVVIINSRPFEGSAMMFPALVLLLIWLIRDKKNSLSVKFTQIILPGALITVSALSAMAYYNYRITGNALKFPYTIHQTQYFSTPLFIFQSPQTSNLKGHPRLQKLYQNLNASSFIKELSFYDLPDNKSLYPIYAFGYLLTNIPSFFLSIPLTFFMYFITFVMIFKDRWMLFIFGTILFTFGCMSTVAYWDFPHYSAPLVACFFLLVVEGFRVCLASGKKQRKKNLTLVFLSILFSVALICQIIYVPYYYFLPNATEMKKEISDIHLDLENPVKFDIPGNIIYLRPMIEGAVNKLPGNYLALVSYDPDFSIWDEIVFNKSDMENAKIVWAYDLGDEKNKVLLDHYSDRKMLSIRISGSQIEINPVPSK